MPKNSALPVFVLLLALTIQGVQATPITADSGVKHQPAATKAQEAKTTSLTWQYEGSNSFEEKMLGYGIAYGFSSDADAKANIYLYDLGKKDWLNGLADPGLQQVMQGIKDEIRLVQQKGLYKQASFAEEGKTSIAGQEFYVQPVQLSTEYDHIRSFVYLTVLNHQLLKFRISFVNPPAFFDVAQISQDFIKNTLNDLQQKQQTTAPKDAGQVL